MNAETCKRCGKPVLTMCYRGSGACGSLCADALSKSEPQPKAQTGKSTQKKTTSRRSTR